MIVKNSLFSQGLSTNTTLSLTQDYLVLLPREYYEAPLLQEKVTQPCTYLPAANRNTK